MLESPFVTPLPIPGLREQPRFYTHAPQGDLVSRKLHRERVWEPFETRLWLASQRRDDVVLDVGANLGYYTILSALSRAPAKAIFSFEPEPRNFALLEDNLALNACGANVTAVNAALALVGGSGTLHQSADNYGDHQIYAGDGRRRSTAIQLLNGAEFLNDKASRVTLLKVDTQGSEDAVIAGLMPLLQRSRVGLRMLIELTPRSLRLAGSSGAALLDRLATLDLPMFIVDHIEHRLVPSDHGALRQWSENVAAQRQDCGFMNIFVGESPLL